MFLNPSRCSTVFFRYPRRTFTHNSHTICTCRVMERLVGTRGEAPPSISPSASLHSVLHVDLVSSSALNEQARANDRYDYLRGCGSPSESSPKRETKCLIHAVHGSSKKSSLRSLLNVRLVRRHDGCCYCACGPLVYARCRGTRPTFVGGSPSCSVITELRGIPWTASSSLSPRDEFGNG